MPVSPNIYNTGGYFRFIDYVSMLPEFLREENDVVTLMQIFSDYLNNAYRNVAVATKYEFKLVATEGMVGKRTLELERLRQLFMACEKKSCAMLYMLNPLNPATVIVEYEGSDETPNENIVPGGLGIGERVYVEYTNHPERSGVYMESNGILVLDPKGAMQDPFGGTPDKPMISAVGIVPRMIQFYPSDCSEVGSRKVAQNNGVVYYEVFFSASINNITDVPSVDNYTYRNGKYLVDYYNYLLQYPDEYNYGKFSIGFDEPTCAAFSIGRGVFYARDLTEIDTRPEMVDSQGKNRYLDPSFTYYPTPIPPTTLPITADQTRLYYSMEKATSNRYLQIPMASSYITPVVGDYVNRIILGSAYSSFNFASINIVENIFILDIPTQLKIHEQVHFTMTSGTLPGGLVDNGIYTISWVSDDGLNFKLDGVDITTSTAGVGKISRMDVVIKDVAIVQSTTYPSLSPTITYSSYTGDVISSGTFGIIRGNRIAGIFSTQDISVPWTRPAIYYVGDHVTYKGMRYRVILTADTNTVPGTPDVEGKYYVIDMDSISVLATEIDMNPYMFGEYDPRRLFYDQSIDYDTEFFENLYASLIVQQAEDVSINIRYPQRDWSMNPTVAKKIDPIRNGWMSIIDNGRNDCLGKRDYTPAVGLVPEDHCDQLYIYATNAEITHKTVTLTFNQAHGLSIGDHIRIIGDNSHYLLINGVFPVTSVPTSTKVIYECVSDAGSSPETITGDVLVSYADTLQPDTILFAKQNIIRLTKINPAVAQPGYYYKYTLRKTDWRKYSDRVVPDVVDCDVVNISVFHGEYSAPKYSDNAQSFYFTDGLVVNLVNQTDPATNGYWRVKKNANWTRVGAKAVIKVGNIEVESEPVLMLDVSDDQIYYMRYSQTEVDNFIANNRHAFVAGDTEIFDYNFDMPVVPGIDTTKSFHQIYDARHDSNTVATMPSDFVGVPDMKYPIAEKIERLAYTKDPNVIDFDLIGYLARFMGYDITQIIDDIGQSELYKTSSERELALRKFIQMLPEFNALKSTEKGIELVMLTFGIVGKVVKLWTEDDAPYKNFIPDDDVINYSYGSMESGKRIRLVGTPHFKVSVEVDGNFDNDLTLENIGRLRKSVISYKPINTVFQGIEAYMKITAHAGIWISPMNAKGRLQADVGYDINFGEQIPNNCAI